MCDEFIMNITNDCFKHAESFLDSFQADTGFILIHYKTSWSLVIHHRDVLFLLSVKLWYDN